MLKPAKTMKKELNKYYRGIARLLPDSGKKRRIVSGIKNGVAVYLKEKPDAAISDVVEKFGTPDEICQQYYDGDIAQELALRLNRRNRLVIAVIAAVLTIIGLLLWIIMLQSQSVVIYQTDSPAVVESRIEYGELYNNLN